MIPGLGGIVEKRPVGLHDDILERHLGKGGIENQLVELVHIARIVLVVVVTHGLLGNGGRKGVVSVRELPGRKPRGGCRLVGHKG